MKIDNHDDFRKLYHHTLAIVSGRAALRDRFAAHPQRAPRQWATRSTGEFANGTFGENCSGVYKTTLLQRLVDRNALNQLHNGQSLGSA